MYRRVFVAGTFDRLHKGHKFLLRRAFEIGDQVDIGLTTDTYVNKFKNQKSKGKIDKIQEYEKRKKNLEFWLSGGKKHFAVIPIDEPYEPLVSNAAAGPDTALLVTPDNKKRGEEINVLRKSRGLASLSIVEVPLIPAEDVKPISSTRIRAKEIDRSGRLVMPDNLRPELQKPLGSVLTGNAIMQSIERHMGQSIIAVGDMATKTILDSGVVPALAIIDGKIGRKVDVRTKKQLLLLAIPTVAVQSGPGYVSYEAIKIISSFLASDTGNQRIKKHQVIVVDGEEDLLVLPAVQYASFGSVVYYGQPRIVDVLGKPRITRSDKSSGLVEVIATKEKKQEVAVLLARFLS